MQRIDAGGWEHLRDWENEVRPRAALLNLLVGSDGFAPLQAIQSVCFAARQGENTGGTAEVF